jgi:hypothetical protein
MILTRAALLLACLVPVLPADSQPARRPGGVPLRGLFVGNSYTYFNNLPYLLEALAQSDKGSRPVKTRMVVQGGATLQDFLVPKRSLGTHGCEAPLRERPHLLSAERPV